MYALKHKVTNACMECKSLLPNDLAMEVRFETAKKNMEYIMTVYINDVRTRCKLPCIIQEPLGDYYFRKNTLAFNDIVQ